MFGTSHLAALRLAHQSGQDRWPDLDITFIGATEKGLLDHTIRDGVMYPETSELKEYYALMGGVDALELRRFDAFAMIGCHVGPQMIGHIYGQARWCALPSLQRKAPQPDAHWTLMSEPAVDAVLAHRITHSVGGQLGRALRGVSDRPIVLASAPRPSTELMERKTDPLIAQKWAVKKGDARHMSKRYDRIAKACLAKDGITYLRQPNRTITSHLLTRPEYMLGAVRLTIDGQVPQPRNDIRHGNQFYGEAILDQISGAVAAPSADVKQ